VIVELRLALVREHGQSPIYRRLRPDAADRARRLFATQLRSPNEVLFLAERRGNVVGILRCVQMSGLPLLFPALHGYISSVYVVPAARRQGVLRALLASAIKWCEARGLTEIRLHNAVENAAANAAWESLGFRIAEHLRVRRLR
jgi:ribosomal protein S18 acetylase RimI-like enzyme